MEMGGEGSPEFVHLVLTRDTHYQDHALEMNTLYHYRVTAHSDVGEGSPSGVASIILIPPEFDPVDFTEDLADGPDELPVDYSGGDDIDMQLALYESSTGTCAGILTEINAESVSYTHLTLPTTPYV